MGEQILRYYAEMGRRLARHWGTNGPRDEGEHIRGLAPGQDQLSVLCAIYQKLDDMASLLMFLDPDYASRKAEERLAEKEEKRIRGIAFSEAERQLKQDAFVGLPRRCRNDVWWSIYWKVFHRIQAGEEIGTVEPPEQIGVTPGTKKRAAYAEWLAQRNGPSPSSADSHETSPAASPPSSDERS